MDELVSAQALRESEELHRITLLSMSDAVFITDDEGVFTFICPNVDVIFGYGPPEVSMMKRISRLMGRTLVEPGELNAKGELRNIEHEIETKEGNRRVLLIHVKPVSIRGGTILYVCRDITERKQSEHALRCNEQRLTLALEAANAGTWDWHVPSGEMKWSPEAHRLFGDAAGTREPSFAEFIDHVHPSDRQRVAHAMREAMDRSTSYETEFRVTGYDGVERWVMAKGKALRNGKPVRMLGVFVEFTERHRVEEERHELSGRLINAHEQERRRLSRELHDDMNQRIALLSAELALLRRTLTTAPQGIRDQIAKVSAIASEIGSELHRVAHELHPNSLEHLGLEQSIRSYCNGVAAAHQITVGLQISDLPPLLDTDAALCLYRIAQEALHNVVKHSGAAGVTVALRRDRSDVLLQVIDDGAGFDPLTAGQKDTLGLVSMRERARLVQGHLTVASRPGHGTTIEARIPVSA